MDYDELIRFAQTLDRSKESIDTLCDYLLDRFRLHKLPDRNIQRQGTLITFDGHSGAGKDTQASLLKEYLHTTVPNPEKTISCIALKRIDPFRQVVKYLWANPELAKDGDPSFLLLSAGRKYAVQASILPLLEDPRTVVIQNRSYLSHTAYCASCPDELPGLRALADFDPRADVPLILECDVEIACRRVQRRSPEKGGVMYPNERPDFIARAKRHFRELGSLLDNLVFVDTSGPHRETSREIIRHVDRYLACGGGK